MHFGHSFKLKIEKLFMHFGHSFTQQRMRAWKHKLLKTCFKVQVFWKW